MPIVDDAWKSWLKENISRGCSPESMAEAMVRGGFDSGAAWSAIHALMNPSAADAAQAALDTMMAAPVKPRDYQYDASPIAKGNRIDVGDREVEVVARCDFPQVVVFANLLSAEECDEMVTRSRSKLKRSTTVNPQTGKEDVIDRRTSDGTFFRRGEDEFITRLEARISRLMNWPVENGEGLQILRYGVGGEYRPHFDYFPPSDPGSATHLSRGGQRVSTLVVYLNDVDEGGETIFPDAGIAVAPRKGGAVYFRYFNGLGQIDPLTLHGGAPVIAGEKWIMTKWMRQSRYG